MGQAMVRRLLDQGHQVTVWNRSPAAGDELVALGARRATSIEEAFTAGPVLSMLANDAAVDDVFSQETLQAAPPGSVHVNLATVSLDIAQELTSRHAAAGVGYLAVPVLGRPPVAEQGQLNLLAAGDAELLQSLEPVLTSLGKKTWRFGDRPWQANVAKISHELPADPRPAGDGRGPGIGRAARPGPQRAGGPDLRELLPRSRVQRIRPGDRPKPLPPSSVHHRVGRQGPGVGPDGRRRRSAWTCRPHRYSTTSSVPRSTWAWVSTTGPPSPRSPAAESPPHRHPYLPHRRTES